MVTFQEQTTKDLPKVTGVNRKIAFSSAGVGAGACARAGPGAASRNKQLDQFKSVAKTGAFVPFSGKGHKLGSS